MAKNKIIKGNIPYSSLNRTLNAEPDEETIKDFEGLLTQINGLSEEEKQQLLKSR